MQCGVKRDKIVTAATGFVDSRASINAMNPEVPGSAFFVDFSGEASNDVVPQDDQFSDVYDTYANNSADC